MLSLTELQRAGRILDRTISGCVLQRTAQLDAHRLVVFFNGPSFTGAVLMSCRPGLARIGLPAVLPNAPAEPPSFVQYIRAHVGRGRCSGVTVAADERILRIRLANRGGEFVLLLSIFGARSNVYLLDGGETLLHAMRPLRTTRKELIVGQPWVNPAGRAPAAGNDRWAEIPDGDFLVGVETAYEQLERLKDADDLSRRIGTVLGREEALLNRKATNLLEDLGEAHQAEEYRRRGELLKGALHRIAHGDRSVRAVDISSGKEVEIALDPALSPAQNLQAYFGRYQKELRGAAAIEDQLHLAQESRAELETLRRALAEAGLSQPGPNLDALRELANHRRIRRLMVRYYPGVRPVVPARERGRKEVPARLRPKRYRTDDGLEVWVGRSDEGNDYLTTRLARGNDLFFHLDGYPGSHVILRTEGRPDAPSGSLLAACELAVHYSRFKAAGSADVRVVSVKNVRKPKGARPGTVYLTGGRTIHLRRDPKRLEGILASRLDD